jgi:hypothetical protein
VSFPSKAGSLFTECGAILIPRLKELIRLLEAFCSLGFGSLHPVEVCVAKWGGGCGRRPRARLTGCRFSAIPTV